MAGNNTHHFYSDRERTILTVYLGMVVIPVAIIMNSLMIVSFVKYKKLRITGMYFILNLAISNLVATTISAPIIISNIIKDNPGEGVLENGFVCDLRALLDATLLCVSAITLGVSSVDRCWAVWRPFNYHKAVTTRGVLWVILGIWITCFLVSLPPVQFVRGKSWGEYKYSQMSYSCGVGLAGYYLLFYCIFALFIPVTIACFSYSLILSVAIKSINNMGSIYRSVDHSESKRTKRTLKSSLRTLALVGVFAVTMLPTLAIGVILWCEFRFKGHTTLKISKEVGKVLNWITYSGYALNPIIYGLMDRNFRGAYKTFLKCNLSQNEFRRRAQKQLYSDLMDDRQRSLRLRSRSKGYSTQNSEYYEHTQSIALTELRSVNGSSTPKSLRDSTPRSLPRSNGSSVNNKSSQIELSPYSGPTTS